MNRDEDILDFELSGDVWEESAPRRSPRWIQVTALIVLIAFILPVLGSILGIF